MDPEYAKKMPHGKHCKLFFVQDCYGTDIKKLYEDKYPQCIYRYDQEGLRLSYKALDIGNHKLIIEVTDREKAIHFWSSFPDIVCFFIIVYLSLS